MPIPNDALNYAKRFIGNMPLDDATIKTRILNDAHNKFWMAADWRWSINTPVIGTITNDIQSGFTLDGALTHLFLVHVMMNDGDQKWDLAIQAALPVIPDPSTGPLIGKPSQAAIYFDGTSYKVHLFPIPHGFSTGTPPRIIVTTKKKSGAAIVGTEDYLATYGVPDEYFWVYQEIVLLKAYQFSNSPRLGSVTMANNAMQFTGQFGVVEEAINSVKVAEKKYLDSIGRVVING